MSSYRSLTAKPFRCTFVHRSSAFVQGSARWSCWVGLAITMPLTSCFGTKESDEPQYGRASGRHERSSDPEGLTRSHPERQHPGSCALPGLAHVSSPVRPSVIRSGSRVKTVARTPRRPPPAVRIGAGVATKPPGPDTGRFPCRRSSDFAIQPTEQCVFGRQN